MSFLPVFLSDLTVLDCLSLVLPLKPVGVSICALFILVSDYLFRHITISFSLVDFGFVVIYLPGRKKPTRGSM